MSTKTTFKRIALVAIAALGFGTLSVVPSSAVVSNPVYAIDYAASTIELGQDAVLVLHQDFLGDTGAQVVMNFTVTQNVFGADTTTATTNVAMPKVYLGSDVATVSTGTAPEVLRGYATAAPYSGFPAADIAAAKVNINNTQTGGTTTGTALTSSATNTVTAAASGSARTRGFQRVEWTPTVVGTYSLTVSSTAGGVANAAGTYVWTFKVNAAGTAAKAAAAAALALATPSATFSRSVMGYENCLSMGATSICDTNGNYAQHAYGAGGFGSYSATMQATLPADDAIYYTKNLTPAGQSVVAAGIIGTINTDKSTGNTPVAMPGAYVWAEITGPGWLTLEDPQAASTNNSKGRATWIKLSSLTDNSYRVMVGTDGTPGTAEVKIYAANAPAATRTLIATKKVNFFDTPTKASLTQSRYSINGDAFAAATTVASLSVKDANDILVPYAHFTNLGYYATAASANTTVLPAQTALTSKSVTLQPKGAFYGTSDVIVTVQNDAGASAASIAAGTSAPTGFSDAAKLIPTVKFATAAQSVIVAKNKIATLTVTPSNGGQWAPASAQTLTFVAKDVNGLAVPDSLTAAVTSVSTVATSIATQNGVVLADFASLNTLGGWGYASLLGTDPAGTMSLTIYAPVVEGEFTLSMLLGSTNYETALAATIVSLKPTVTASAATIVAQAASDLAAEALDAATAAIDAANIAAENADAATAAAMEATDAVAALAVTTQAQIASMRLQNIALRKQIIALTNLIIKIQKKVKA